MAQGKAYTEEEKLQIIRSLKPYLELGYSRNKACDFIGLSPSTLGTWVADEEALRMELQSSENMVNTIAIQNVVDAIKKEGELEDDIKKENSWKWLERRMKDEFSTRSELTGKDGEAMEITTVPIKSLTNTLYGNNEPDTSTDIGDTGQV